MVWSLAQTSLIVPVWGFSGLGSVRDGASNCGLSHQPQRTRLRRAYLLKAQPCPHFAMALAIKR